MAIDEARELPIYGRLGEMSRLLAEAGALVLSAEPGAGKTSLAPLAAAGMLPGTRAPAEGRVIVVEPRRVAALAAAERMAAIAGTAVGAGVGYRVKGASSVGAATRVEVVTPGVLVRMLQDDPELARSCCVILDEFHERSAQADLAAALLLEARQYRPGLLLLAMSATIDSADAAGKLGAAVMEVPGRSFPIRTRHAPLGGRLDRGGGPGFEEEFARLALELADEAEGDVLAFLPGAAEIGRAAEACERLGRGRVEAARLHGSMPLAEQVRAIAPPPGAPRRIVLATSVAETSLTVARVRAVLDSGLARITRFHARSGLNRLTTELEARDRADQRRGRAGRLGPGLCLRAFSAAEALAERTEPEIFRSELSALALEAAVRGSGGRLDLPWIDAPPEGAWSAARELLTELGALDSSGGATELGGRMARLGTEPRLAALVLRGAAAGEARTACLAAALLSERGGGGPAAERDLSLRLESLESGGRDPGSAAVLAEAARLARAAGARLEGPVRPSSLGELLASAFPDRVARRLEYRGTDATFRMAGGRALRASGALASAEWIVAVDADAGSTEGKVFSGCAVDEASALAALGPSTRTETAMEWRGLSCRAMRRRVAIALPLGRAEAVRLGPGEAAAALASRVASEGLGFLPWDEGGGGALLARLRWLSSARAGDGAPDFGEGALASSAASWLGPFVREDGDPAIDGARLRSALASLIPRELAAALEREAPERLSLPSGSSRRIDYASPGGPSVEARAQELFGLSEHPRIGPRGAFPLVLRLLDPGGKPLQVTSDLPGFWKGAWAEARRQLRGRYPKHDWPEDPARAAPSGTGVKKRGGRG
jgi:ATP-dependent helicase HrpB